MVLHANSFMNLNMEVTVIPSITTETTTFRCVLCLRSTTAVRIPYCLALSLILIRSWTTIRFDSTPPFHSALPVYLDLLINIRVFNSAHTIPCAWTSILWGAECLILRQEPVEGSTDVRRLSRRTVGNRSIDQPRR